jgi:hypothetical protein
VGRSQVWSVRTQGTPLCPLYVVLYVRWLRQEDLWLCHICKFDIICIDQQRSHMGHLDFLALAVQAGSMLTRLLHCWASKRSWSNGSAQSCLPTGSLYLIGMSVVSHSTYTHQPTLCKCVWDTGTHIDILHSRECANTLLTSGYPLMQCGRSLRSRALLPGIFGWIICSICILTVPQSETNTGLLVLVLVRYMFFFSLRCFWYYFYAWPPPPPTTHANIPVK